jgi:RNA polymerase sigma-70 factor (ECF subfamily)
VREDRLLIRRFNAGDTAALRRIYNKYRLDLLSVAGALLNDPASCEDVLHDVFVGFASQAGRFELIGSLKGYLAICVANRARNANRQDRQIGPERLIEARPRQSGQPDSSQAVAYEEQRLIVTSALAQLPEEQRQVIVLHVLGCLRFRQIAQLIGESINTVQSRYRYGLRKLQALLDGKTGL